MTRKEAAKINYMVGEIVLSFDRTFPVIIPRNNLRIQCYSFQSRLNDFKEELYRLRSDIADYLLEEIEGDKNARIEH